MSKESRPSVLSPIISPEAGHIPEFVEFINQTDGRYQNITLYVGKSYIITHRVPIEASYQGENVCVHQISGRFSIAKPKNPAEDMPSFFCILNNATVMYSPQSAPHEQQTAQVDRYYFHLTTESSVTQIL
jgi:hypothetical protein